MSEISILTFLGLAGLLGLALNQKIKNEKKLKRQPIRIRVDENGRRD